MEASVRALQVMISSGSLHMSCCSMHFVCTAWLDVHVTLAATGVQTVSWMHRWLLLHCSRTAHWAYTYPVVLATVALPLSVSACV
jgi:hypothetical protein